MKITQAAYEIHRYWMQQAVILGQKSGETGEIPIGAVIVDENNQLIAQSGNQKESNQDPTAHAELLAIRLASQHLQSWRLTNCTLYATLEPCPMCAGAIIHARLKSLVYGVDDPKTGAIRTVLNLPDSDCSNHRLSVIMGIEENACRQLLQDWFQKRRFATKEDKR